MLLANVAIAIPGLHPPGTLHRDSGEHRPRRLGPGGTILVTSMTTPFVAIYSTLLYYDMRARKTL